MVAIKDNSLAQSRIATLPSAVLRSVAPCSPQRLRYSQHLFSNRDITNRVDVGMEGESVGISGYFHSTRANHLLFLSAALTSRRPISRVLAVAQDLVRHQEWTT